MFVPFRSRTRFGRGVRGRGGLRSHVHWETQGHLELATGGTTTVRGSSACVSLELVHMRWFAAKCRRSIGRSTVHSSSSLPADERSASLRICPPEMHRFSSSCDRRFDRQRQQIWRFVDRERPVEAHLRNLGHCEGCVAEMATGGWRVEISGFAKTKLKLNSPR